MTEEVIVGEVTEAMIEAGKEQLYLSGRDADDTVSMIYTAMRSAAPVGTGDFATPLMQVRYVLRSVENGDNQRGTGATAALRLVDEMLAAISTGAVSVEQPPEESL